MTHILNSGYSVLNTLAGPSGIAVAGSADSGSISQYNNGKVDTISPGDASKDGSIKSVIAADSSDTVNLGTGWQNAGSAVDETTGISGALYTSSTGDQILISGNATVHLADASTPGATATPATPTPSPSPSPTSSATPAITPTPANTSPNYFQPAPTVSQSKRPQYPYQKNKYSSWLQDYLYSYTQQIPDSSLPTPAPKPHNKFPTNKWYTLNPIAPFAGGNDYSSVGASYYVPDDLGAI